MAIPQFTALATPQLFVAHKRLHSCVCHTGRSHSVHTAQREPPAARSYAASTVSAWAQLAYFHLARSDTDLMPRSCSAPSVLQPGGTRQAVHTSGLQAGGTTERYTCHQRLLPTGATSKGTHRVAASLSTSM
jgi:hypothetical protein